MKSSMKSGSSPGSKIILLNVRSPIRWPGWVWTSLLWPSDLLSKRIPEDTSPDLAALADLLLDERSIKSL